MILLSDYLGNWGPMATDEHVGNAVTLLEKVNEMLDAAFEDGVDLEINPKTGSYISGEKYGGYRPADCAIGSAKSAHKTGQAVDVYDPSGAIDEWCLKHLHELMRKGLCMEAPSATKGWCHLSTRYPASGKVVFLP